MHSKISFTYQTACFYSKLGDMKRVRQKLAKNKIEMINIAVIYGKVTTVNLRKDDV